MVRFALLRPLSLWWVTVLCIGTQEQCGVRVSTVYLPLVCSRVSLSFLPQDRVNAGVGCALTPTHSGFEPRPEAARRTMN